MNTSTNFLYENISSMIQSLESKRDYTDEGLSDEEEKKLESLNKMWDSVRQFYDFEEPEDQE